MPTKTEKEEHALAVGVTSVTAFHYLEASNPEHRSWMPHIIWAVIPKFIAERGNIWRFSTAKLEARGAAAKRIGRAIVCWRKRKLGASTRTISKLSTIASREAGEVRTGTTTFQQTYSSTGEKQLLENIGLREQQLREGNDRKSRKLSQLGRLSAPRVTAKHHEASLAETGVPFTCAEVLEAIVRGHIARPYTARGKTVPEAFRQLEYAVQQKSLQARRAGAGTSGVGGGRPPLAEL